MSLSKITWNSFPRPDLPLAVKITVGMGHATYPATISDSSSCLKIRASDNVLTPHLSCRCIHHAFNTCTVSDIIMYSVHFKLIN